MVIVLLFVVLFVILMFFCSDNDFIIFSVSCRSLNNTINISLVSIIFSFNDTEPLVSCSLLLPIVERTDILFGVFNTLHPRLCFARLVWCLYILPHLQLNVLGSLMGLFSIVPCNRLCLFVIIWRL